MIEILSRRTKAAKHFDLGGNSRQALFAPDQHYQDEQGNWQDIDLTLEDLGSNTWRMNKHALNVDIINGEIAITRKNGKGISFPLPPGFIVDGKTVEFTFDGLVWCFTLSKVGMKLTATVATRRGAKKYNFNYSRLFGANALELDSQGNLVSDEFMLPRPYAISATGKRYLGSWSINPARATLEFDDTQIPDGEFPYVLDPSTTFNVSASGNDGYVFVTDASANWPPSGIVATDTNAGLGYAQHSYFDDGGGFVTVLALSLIKFDTSSLEDDITITDGTLRLYVYNATAGSLLATRFLVGEYYSVGTIDEGDYTNGTPGESAFTELNLDSFTDEIDNDIALLNPNANISKTGETGFRLALTPVTLPSQTGVADFIFAFFDHSSLTEPRLLVTYTESAPASASIAFANRRGR